MTTPTPAQHVETLRRVYDQHLGSDIPAWVIENIQAVSAYMKARGHEEWTIAGVRSPAAHAREVEANGAYIREADRRISELASLLNRSNVDRYREVEALTKGLRVAAIALAHASETDATYRPAYQHVSDLLAGTHIADAGNMVEALRLRAEAAEADARRYAFLRNKCNHGDDIGITEIRFSHAAPPDAAIDAAISAEMADTRSGRDG